uniref:PCRF domain-containing protein n=1 Tax=Heterorhabditis bacteriophora TaxID=37862 RepID=A0A1I7X8L3_HETBA
MTKLKKLSEVSSRPTLCGSEQSLAQLDSYISLAGVEAELSELDTELAGLVESHGEVGAQGEAALQEV